MRIGRIGLVFLAATVGLVVVAQQTGRRQATATFRDASGKDVGQATLVQTQHGVLVKMTLAGLPAGEHAFHVHETGKCEPPFKTAGGHFNPTKKAHGISAKKGMHAGDLPNIHVPQAGAVELSLFLADVTLDKGRASLLDSDGSALVLHAGPDDYVTDPAGNAGDRIACAVVQEGAAATDAGTR